MPKVIRTTVRVKLPAPKTTKPKKKPREWTAWAVLVGDLSYEYDPGTSRHGRCSVYISRASALKAAYGQKDSLIKVKITEVCGRKKESR